MGRVLQLRDGEGAPVGLLFGWYFCVIGAAFVARAVRDALFLAHLSAAQLPAMYIASPLVMTLVGLTYARVEGRVRRDRLVIGTLLASAVAMVGARLAVGTGDWIYYALYIAANVMSGLVIMQLWTVASDRFTSRDAKRLFGVIGAGGTAADIAIGAVLSVLAPQIAVEDLLYVCAGLLAAAAGLAVALRRRSGATGFGGARARPSLLGGAARPPGASHLRLVGAALVCSVIVVTLVEFQFKAVTAAAYGDDRAGMVRYFGNMSIATGIVSLAIQLVATHRVLHRLGVAGALLVLPLGLAAGEIGLLLVPGLVAATILKASDETFRFTVNDAASQLLFLPVPSRARGRWKAIVDNAWKPGAQLGLGLALLGYRAIAPGSIGPLVAIACATICVWLAVIVKLRGAYVRALGETLRRRPAALDATVISREEVGVIGDALRSTDPVQLLAALGLARPIAAELADAIVPHVDHADARVRSAAGALLGAVGPRADVDTRLRARLADDDPDVRTAALGALLARGDDPEARRTLDRLATSADPDDRVRAARALGALGTPRREEVAGDERDISLADAGAGTLGGAPVPSFAGESVRAADDQSSVHEVATLLADRDLVVVRAAAETAAALGVPALLDALLARAGDVRDLAPALAACGRGGEARIDAAIGSAHPVTQRELIRALGLLATPVAAACLVAHCAGDATLRTHAARALARAVRRTPTLAFDRERVRALIDAELAAAYLAMAAAEGLGGAESAMIADGTRARVPFLPNAPEGAAALLSKTLRDRQERHRDRCFALLAVLYGDAGIDTIAANLAEPDPARRANALELLESVLDRDLRARVMPLVDESPRSAKLVAIGKLYPLPHNTTDEWVAVLLADAAPWLLACTAYYAGVHHLHAAGDRLRELAHHDDLAVREAAALAVSYLS